MRTIPKMQTGQDLCTTMDTPSAATTTPRKLRLMCSYGGRIVQFPCKKSFLYAGGDTRIISIPTATNKLTISSITAHLSVVLNISTPFNLKYLLPGDALDSLISVCTEDDLLIMLDEHRHNLGAPRIRLFLFPAEKHAATQLKHPKTESWFVDTLKSAQFMQCERSSIDSNNSSNGISEAEPVLLEATSSFGSASSSGGDAVNGAALKDTTNKLKSSTPESVPSDNSVALAARHQHCGAVPVAAGQNLVFPNPCIPGRKAHGPCIASVGVDQMVDVSRIPLPQKLQFVPAGASNYVLPNPTSAVPIPSYYVVNSQLPQQQIYCGTNQSQAVVPAGKPYNHPPQSSLIHMKTAACNPPMMHPVSYANSGQVAYKAAAGLPLPETISQVYQPIPMSNPIPIVPACENHHHAGLLPQINNQALSIGVTSVEIAKYVNEPVDNSECALIYKSQPPPPFTTLPCQFQTMSKAETLLLSEKNSQLQMNNVKQQQRTPLTR